LPLLDSSRRPPVGVNQDSPGPEGPSKSPESQQLATLYASSCHPMLEFADFDVVLCRTLLTQMLEFAAFFGTWLASGPHPAHRQAPTLNRYDRSLSARWHRPIPTLPNRARTRPGWAATVYLPTDLRHGRLFALKVLRPEIAVSLGAERFLREIHHGTR
jgi:hypothetical protein